MISNKKNNFETFDENAFLMFLPFLVSKEQRLTTVEGKDVVLMCPLMEEFQFKHFKSDMEMLQWTRNGTVIASYRKVTLEGC